MKEIKIPIKKFTEICDEFKEKWKECQGLNDKDRLRDEFFSLPVAEPTLERGWDYITLDLEKIPYSHNTQAVVMLQKNRKRRSIYENRSKERDAFKKFIKG